MFVFANSSGTKNIGGAKWVTIGTLPVGYRPDFNVTATLNGAGANLGGWSAEIDTDGNIDCYTSLTSAVKYWNFVCSFPA